MYCMIVWNFVILLLQSSICVEDLERPEMLNFATSRVVNHKLSTYLLVAFNIGRATCHQEEDIQIAEFFIAIYQSWFLITYLSTLSNWAKFKQMFCSESLRNRIVFWFGLWFLQKCVARWGSLYFAAWQSLCGKDEEAEAVSGEAAPNRVTVNN